MKKTARQVLQRQLDLCEYFNSIDNGSTGVSNEALMDMFGYSSRSTLQRDLKTLEQGGYIKTETKIATPVKVADGQANQFVRKYRTIHFMPSKDGLLAFSDKTRHIAPGYTLYEDEKRNDKWMISKADHTLIKNPNYTPE